LRRAKSPIAPKTTIMQGSGTRGLTGAVPGTVGVAAMPVTHHSITLIAHHHFMMNVR